MTEDQLHTRAEMLEETGELAGSVAGILAAASGAGVDPDAVTSLRAAFTALDPAGAPAPVYRAGSSTDRHAGTGYGSDAEFLEEVADTEAAVAGRLRDTGQLLEAVSDALDKARDDLARAVRDQDLERAQEDLGWAHSLPTRSPCTGCHGYKAAAIGVAEKAVAAARERRADAARRISVCEDAAEILDPLADRLQTALRALRQVPHDLGEAYDLVYAFVSRGGKLPRYGRWIEGDA